MSYEEKCLVILRVLSDGGEQYGLDIVKASDGVHTRGTVYVYLSGMQDQGVVASRVEDDPPPPPQIPRRLYRITDRGRRALAESARAERRGLGRLTPRPA